METEQGYIRRGCGVLLAEVGGSSESKKEDEVATAGAVQRLRTLAREIVLEAGGQTEALDDDSFWAIFESAAGAVGAGLAIQQRAAVEVKPGTELRFRIGVHVGDVLLRDGRALGDAVTIAARLRALAAPGTLCISDAVRRQVRPELDVQLVDMGPQRLRNISDPIRAYRMIPREMAVAERRWARWRPSRRTWLAAALLLAGSTVTLVLFRFRPNGGSRDEPGAASPSDEEQTVGLGVMGFRGPGPEGVDDWRREALRDGLNARLASLSKVKVYSKEFIDFLITRKGLSEIEAATQLGIKKMLGGSFFEVDGEMRVETHVVDVATGVIDAAYTTTCRAGDFLELPGRLAVEIIARLDLPVTAEERSALLAPPSVDAEALKLLLETETGGGGHAEEKMPDPGTEPRSILDRWREWGSPSEAFADDAAEAAIRDLLERYRKAVESRALEELANLYTEFTSEQRAAQQRYFEATRDLKVAIDQVDVAVVGDEAVVSYTRTDDFVDTGTGRPMHVSVRVTKPLRRSDGNWRFGSGP